jgi:uncharacterized protein YutE (UPF0331/DUF86 family)
MNAHCESVESAFSMDKEVIGAKIETLRRCVRRIREKTPAASSTLRDNYDLQDIISLNLERAVQTSVDLASHVISESDLPAAASMAEAFDRLQQLNFISEELAIRMKKAVGFRNIAVHAYQEIDWEIVFSIITKRLTDFVEFGKAIARAADL